MADHKIRVLMVDDHELMRQAYGMYLNDEPDIDVIGYAGDGQEAVAMTATQKPDVIIMDGKMPRLNGIEAAAIIRERSPETGIVPTMPPVEVSMTETDREAELAANA